METFFNMIETVNSFLSKIVWGAPMLILMIGGGLFFCIKLRFFHITHLTHWLGVTFAGLFKTTQKGDKALSPFTAMSTALAATIGTGNIAGVAAAISLGGAGAIFWMWVSAFFGMITSFCEKTLGIHYRKKDENGEWYGGAMYYIEAIDSKGFIGRNSKKLASLFAVLCAAASFGVGNLVQSNTISATLDATFSSFGVKGISKLAIGIIIMLLTGIVIIGGIKRIGSVAERLVPFMALLYMAGTIYIIMANVDMLPHAMGAIFKNAFGFDSIAGGISGHMLSRALSEGFKKGVFSSEAGMGASVTAHSASDVSEPCVQGMWGIFETFFDTIVVCSLTAFAVLCSGIYDFQNMRFFVPLEANELVISAFSKQLGSMSSVFVSIATVLFAFASILGWSFYGVRAVGYLFGKRSEKIYKFLFCIFTAIGAVVNIDFAWEFSETLNALTAIPNMTALIILMPVTKRLTDSYLKQIKENKKQKRKAKASSLIKALNTRSAR